MQFFSTILKLVLLLILAGCSVPGGHTDSAMNTTIPHMNTAPLPHYQVGTKFIYSNGTWEKVVETGPDWVKWVNQNKNISTGSPDITYKRTNWQTSRRQGSRTFNQVKYWLGTPASTLWPLAAGNVTTFDESGIWYAEDGEEHRYNSFWRCKVEGTETVSVAAGDFETWKITCARYPDNLRYPGSRAREYRTWNYAPVIGHWVLEIRDYNGFKSNRRKELIAVVPDLNAVTSDEDEIRQVRKQFQNVLEGRRKNMPYILAGAKSDLAVTITPKKTFRRTGGAVCRQYVQNITVEGSDHDYFGIACRGPGGGWRIPRL